MRTMRTKQTQAKIPQIRNNKPNQISHPQVWWIIVEIRSTMITTRRKHIKVKRIWIGGNKYAHIYHIPKYDGRLGNDKIKW